MRYLNKILTSASQLVNAVQIIKLASVVAIAASGT